VLPKFSRSTIRCIQAASPNGRPRSTLVLIAANFPHDAPSSPPAECAIVEAWRVFYHKAEGAVQQPIAWITARCARVRRGTAELRPDAASGDDAFPPRPSATPAVNLFRQSQPCNLSGGGDGDAVFFGFFGGRVAT